MLKAGYLRDGDAAAITRAAPPLRRHEDDAACAVIPAAARERRAARLGDTLRAATDGRGLPEWLGLRAALAPEALEALGPALAWTAPREPARAAAGRATRTLSFRHVLRFLQCPLQGSALALLPVGGDDGEAEAAAAFREHEDFDLAWPRALAPLRDALARAYQENAGDDDALARAYDEATAAAELDGTVPHGLFGAATRALHLDCLRAWRATLDELGGIESAPERAFIGHAPERRIGAVVRAAPRLATALPAGDGSRRLAVDLHAETNLLATLGGAPAVLLASSSATPGNGNGRDRLSAFVDQLALAATDPAGAPRRRGVVLRPGQRKPETFWLRAVARDDALDYLRRLATELLGAVHPYFFPCEAVLGWRKKKEPRPELTTYIHTLRDSDWKTYFTSDWGPVPHASAYPLPSEDEANQLVEARFALYFATVEEDTAPPRGATKPPPAPRGASA